MNKILKNVQHVSQKMGALFILIILLIICSLASPKFLTSSNMINVLRQSCVFCIVGLCQGINIISGAIDLSCECAMCLAGIVAIPVYVSTESILLAVLTAIAVGAACSALNGFIIATFDLPPFICGLALQIALRGFIMIVTGGMTIIQTGSNFKLLGQGSIGPIPIAIVVEISAVLLLHIILKYTRFGRNLYALGGNKEAAFAAGINVKLYRVLHFAMAGAFVGLGGFMYMSRINSGAPDGCVGLSGKGIAAAVIGGVAFGGGGGGAVGIMLGSWVICIISNILNLLRVDAYLQDVISGAIIILSVVIDQTSKRGKGNQH